MSSGTYKPAATITAPKLIRIVQSLGPSGRTLSALAIHQAFEESDFTQELWVLEEPRRDAVTAADRFFPHKSGLNPGLLFRLAGELRAATPAIVHTHGTHAHFYGTLAAKTARIKIVLATDHRGDDSQERSLRQRIRNKIVFSLVDRVICMSDDQKRRLQRSYGGPKQRWRRIYIGIDLDKFLRIRDLREAAPRKPVVLCVAHIRADRDHEMLLRAFAAAHKRCPGARLRLAGTGEHDRVVRLKEMAQDLGIAERVEFLGIRSDIPELLEQATIVAHPAKVDALPRSLVEATAAARPVVATRVGGIPEVVQHDRNGFLVPLGEDHAMASALIGLLTAPGQAADMGRAGRERTRRIFTTDRMRRDYLALYRESLSPEMPDRHIRHGGDDRP